VYRSLILCATPRSGTTLLCDLLSGTGAAGLPASYFREQDLGKWAARLGVPPGESIDHDRAYVDAVLRRGTGDTGVFALRLMWNSVPGLMARLDRLHPGLASDGARMEAAFGPPLYVHVSRTDKVAQAVSRLRAEQTGLWHQNADGSERERTAPEERATYDRDRLAEFIEEVEDAEAAWHGWFAANGIAPLELTYEDLAADPLGRLAGLLRAFGADPATTFKAEVRTAKLADDETRAWIARYRKESGITAA
jgi:LPS sulfotransferase NodH